MIVSKMHMKSDICFIDDKTVESPNVSLEENEPVYDALDRARVTIERSQRYDDGIESHLNAFVNLPDMKLLENENSEEKRRFLCEGIAATLYGKDAEIADGDYWQDAFMVARAMIASRHIDGFYNAFIALALAAESAIQSGNEA
jgi:hypothetical protein